MQDLALHMGQNHSVIRGQSAVDVQDNTSASLMGLAGS